MKIDEIKDIVKLMAEYDLTEFKVEAEECNLCIRRSVGAIPAAVQAVPVLQAAPAPVAAPAVAAAPAAEAAPAAPAGIEVPSPLVGTFYRAASPDSAPFVQVGDRVTPDTVIGIIEAMKVMNEIKAEKSGVVKAIPAENGQIVEYGQPLLILD